MKTPNKIRRIVLNEDQIAIVEEGLQSLVGDFTLPDGSPASKYGVKFIRRIETIRRAIARSRERKGTK